MDGQMFTDHGNDHDSLAGHESMSLRHTSDGMYEQVMAWQVGCFRLPVQEAPSDNLARPIHTDKKFMSLQSSSETFDDLH
jgi:hypothetical protein